MSFSTQAAYRKIHEVSPVSNHTSLGIVIIILSLYVNKLASVGYRLTNTKAFALVD